MHVTFALKMVLKRFSWVKNIHVILNCKWALKVGGIEGIKAETFLEAPIKCSDGKPRNACTKTADIRTGLSIKLQRFYFCVRTTGKQTRPVFWPFSLYNSS